MSNAAVNYAMWALSPGEHLISSYHMCRSCQRSALTSAPFIAHVGEACSVDSREYRPSRRSNLDHGESCLVVMVVPAALRPVCLFYTISNERRMAHPSVTKLMQMHAGKWYILYSKDTVQYCIGMNY